MKFQSLFIALGAIALSAPAGADDLREVMAHVYTTNPTILVERANLRITNENYAQSRAIMLPQLSASASTGIRKTEESGSFLAADEDLEPRNAQLRATQNLYTGGRYSASMKQSLASIRAARARLNAVSQDIFQTTVDVYVGVLTQAEIVDIRRESVKALMEEVEAAQARFDVGELTRTDVEIAESRLSTARANLSSAQASLRTVRATYERVTGFPAADMAPLPPLPPLPGSEEEARETALAWNPELEEVRHGEEIAMHGLDVARSDIKPSVSVAGSLSRRDNVNFDGFREDAVEVTATLSIPLFSGGFERSQIRAAKQQVNRERINIRRGERFIIEAATREWAQWQASGDIVSAAEDAVRTAQSALNGIREEVAYGQRSTIDVLNTELQLRDAQIRYALARQERYLAAYRLLGSMGLLTPDYLEIPVEEYDPDEDLRAVKWKFLSTSIKP